MSGTSSAVPVFRFAGLLRFMQILNWLSHVKLVSHELVMPPLCATLQLGVLTRVFQGRASLTGTFVRMIPIFGNIGFALVSVMMCVRTGSLL